ncbi:VanZ family protein [Alkalicoccobacillus porphyridii]|uniref:VanZ family protein n=1 Tax=Alkalicoccobacillus porphyridii TaxID=2597270 RepID=A0A554A1T1_9BACI|nr:VanZ family protein [Alkalicoccobacillus porphyridii]TSB47643.1 VanZ family protein [Alkalicoccobacillus porphyridii]
MIFVHSYAIRRYLFFIFYLVALFYVVWIYKNPHSNQLQYNIIPLHTISLYWHALHHGYAGVAFVNVLGNIMLTMPVGFFTLLFNRKPRLWKALIVGLFLSIVIETGQFVLHVAGISSRSIDIDDVLLNIMGAGTGYLTAKSFLKKSI